MEKSYRGGKAESFGANFMDRLKKLLLHELDRAYIVLKDKEITLKYERTKIILREIWYKAIKSGQKVVNTAK